MNSKQMDELCDNAHIVDYNKNDNIIKQDQAITHAVYLLKGFVKVMVKYFDKEYITDILSADKFIGLPEMVIKDKHFFSVVALGECKVCYIDIKLLIKIMEKNGFFAKDLLSESCSICCEKQKKFFMSIRNNIHGKVANALLYLNHNVFKTEEFDVLLTRLEIAQLTGITRENVSKVLSELQDDGVIKVKEKHIKINDIKLLKKIAHQS